jgi:glycosyltransferase involved in cell wall biosynthesis
MDPLAAVPWQVAKQVLRFGNLFILTSNIASTVRRAVDFEPIDILLVDNPRFVGLEKLLKPKSMFYRPTDLYAEMKEDSKLLAAERQLLSHSAGVIATSRPVLLHALTLKPGLPSLLLENGVEYQHFSQPAEEPQEIKAIPHPRVVYMGAVDSRFDCTTLGFMAEHLPKVHFIISGQGCRLEEVRALQKPNIHVLGPRPYELMPGFLQHSEVGILPLCNTMANSGRSPMKLYEYGAAGLPVVARCTPEMARRKEAFIHLFSTNEEAVECLKNALKGPTDRKANAESCREHSWDAKAAALVNFIREVPGSGLTHRPAGIPSRSAELPPIFFNARFLDQEMTGVQRYARGMLAALEPHLRVLRPKAALRPVRGHLWEQVVLPSACGRSLLWSPGNTGPLAKENQVVTVHDASTLDHPEWFSGKFAVWYRFLLPRLARRVRKIITVSEFSKERLIASCSIAPSKIAVIHNAIDARFQPASPEAMTEFRKRRQLERPYCLYVGSLEPRKNVSVLLKAWRALAPRDCDLVLAGAAGHVFREQGFVELPAGARLFGRVADDELPTLLSAATCFIFPSLYEGFGFPPLEAMACGCPVICSNATSLPEVCGPAFDAKDPASTGAVVYFNPKDHDELGAQLRQVLAMDAETTQRMKLNGMSRAGQFNWDRCATQTWAVLRELMHS